MIQLTSRQQTILTLLLRQSEPIAVKVIAEKYNFSTRTIRYDLEQVKAFIKQSGGLLIKCPGAGISIKLDELTKKALLSEAAEAVNPGRVLSREERVKFILQKLFLSTTPVTLDELAENLQVSRTTVTTDMQYADKALEGLGIELYAKKGEGFKLVGTESKLRQYTVKTLESMIPPHYAVNSNALTNKLLQSIATGHDSTGMAAAYLCRTETDTFVQLMNAVNEIIPYSMHSSDRMKFILYLAVMVIRIRGGNAAEQRSNEQIDMDSRENRMAQLIAGRLSMSFRITLNDSEGLLLAKWIVRCNVKFPPKENDKIIESLSETVDDMMSVLLDFPDYNLPELYRDKLKMNLVSHLKLTIKKYNLQITSLNTLLTQMKVNYPEIFTVSYKMAAKFEIRTGIALGEDEVGFIAIHIAASIEECNRLSTKKAIIVCNTGKGAATVLYNRICNNIPRLEINGTISALDAVENHAIGNVDFIISTIDLPEVKKPVFRVSPIITPGEMAKISSYINGNLAESDLDNLSKEIPKTTVASYEEATVMRCAMILAKLGSMAGEMEQLYGIHFTTDNIFGLSIHLMMSIPRWEKGIYSREPASDRYKDEHMEMFEFIAALLREASKECGINIPDKEALAIMRYFI